MALGGFIDARVELYSPLSIAECRQRLNTVFVGYVVSHNPTATRFSAQARSPTRNVFFTVMHARMEPDGSGTRIVCKVGLSYISKAFSVFGMVAILILAGTVFEVDAGLPSATTRAAFKLAMIPLFLLIPLLRAFASEMSSGDKEKLVAMVRETVDARERQSPFSN